MIESLDLGAGRRRFIGEQAAESKSKATITQEASEVQQARSDTAAAQGQNQKDKAALKRLKDRAIANGTYSAGCPSNPSGDIVYVQQGDCSYNSSVSGPCFLTASFQSWNRALSSGERRLAAMGGIFSSCVT